MKWFQWIKTKVLCSFPLEALGKQLEPFLASRAVFLGSGSLLPSLKTAAYHLQIFLFASIITLSSAAAKSPSTFLL